MTIIPAAIAPPKTSHARISRPRLDALVDAVDSSRITTVFAPAGYGKTTIVQQWADALAKRKRSVLWIAARAGVSSLEEFLDALSASARSVGVEWRAAPDGVAAAKSFAIAVAKRTIRPVLVVDDAQELPEEALDFISQLVSSARDTMTTIIVSRNLNTIPIARFRALGYLFEVGAGELTFTVEEVSELVAALGQGPVDAAQLQQVVEDTNGWPAGIAMTRAIEARHRREGDERFLRPSGLYREFESYFEEEVMSRESEPVRNFLIDTVVLEELTPAACAAVTETEDAPRMLEYVEQSGLFLSVVDECRSLYRYQPLFRQTVLRKLNDRFPARAAELQRRASRHFVAVGETKRAIDHAKLSGDVTFLADQLDTLAETLTYTGYLWLVDELASAMPTSVFACRPRLALAIAWRRIRSLAFEAAETFIGLAESELERRRVSSKNALEIRKLELAIKQRRLMLAAARDDMREIEDHAEGLLREFGDEEPYLSCTLLAQLMASRRELYHFQDIKRLEAEVRRALSRPGSNFASIALKASFAPTLAALGKIEDAEQVLREALTYARSFNNTGVAALPALPLAELLYDRGDVDEAKALVDEHLSDARQWGFVDQIAAGHIVHARLIFNDGDLAGALKALEEMELLAIECGLDRLRAYALSEQVRMLICNGEARRAREILDANGIMNDDVDLYPGLNPTRRHEALAIAAIRVEMQEHRLFEARKLAKRWSRFVRGNGAARSAVMFELLLAEIGVLAGDRSEARRALREAVSLAAPAGWIRVFLDEGEAICSLLIESYGQGLKSSSVPDQFGERLVAAITGSAPPNDDDEYGLASRLANREIEILRLVGAGLRNREIGNRLGLTEGTVKWYMQQIYDKLGVRRRPLAVARAKQLGVLA